MRQRSVPDRARGGGGGRFVPRVQARERALSTDLFFARVVTELHEAGLFDEPARTGVSRRPPRLSRSRQGPLVAGCATGFRRGFRRDGTRIVPP